MRISTIQLALDDKESIADRRIAVEKSLEEIYKSGFKPDMIILPEIWGCGFFDFDNYCNYSEASKGVTYELISKWARTMNCMIHSGSFIEKEGESYYNTSLLIDKEGQVLGSYRKVHLFGFQSKEQEVLTPGRNVSAIKTEFGTVGLSTCYDLRFPEQFRSLVDKETKMFLVASAWPLQRLSHWRLFNQVRALENQCFLISCNCAGEQKGTVLGGHSMVVGPSGDIINEADEKGQILYTEIDLSEVERYRGSFPSLADRVNIE